MNFFRGIFVFTTLFILAPIVGVIALLAIATRPTKWPPREEDPIGDDPGTDADNHRERN